MTNLSLEPAGGPLSVDLSQPLPSRSSGPRANEETFNRHLDRATQEGAVPSEAKQTPASDPAAPPAASDTAEETSENHQERNDQQIADADADGAEAPSDEPSGDEEQNANEVIADRVEITSDAPQSTDGTVHAETQSEVDSKPQPEPESNEASSELPEDDVQESSSPQQRTDANGKSQGAAAKTEEPAAAAAQPAPDSQTGNSTDAIATAIPDDESAKTETDGDDRNVIGATHDEASDEGDQRRATPLAKSTEVDHKPSTEGESDNAQPALADEPKTDGSLAGPSKSHSDHHERLSAASQEPSAANLQPVAPSEPAEVAPAVNPAAAERALGESTSDVAPVEKQATQEAAAAKPATAPSDAPDTRSQPPGRTAIERLVGQVAKPSSEPNAPDGVNRVQFVQRVARAVHMGAERGGEVRLRLAPPELGSVRLEVIVDRGVLAARLEAETPTARALLLDNIPALRERLAEHDIKIGRFDVDLMDQPGEDVREDPADDARWNRDQRQQGSSRKASQTEAQPSPDSATPRSLNTDGELNVVI